jgi:malate/lactate dehydrogenase
VNLAIVGTGNVGAGVLAHISHDIWDAVSVVDRNPDHARAAILDATSADHRLSAKAHVGTLEHVSEADVILHAVGIPIPSGRTADDTFHVNAALVREFLRAVKFKRYAVLVLVASPVDDITRLVCRESGLPRERVLGFGGDLDTNRLRAILSRTTTESTSAQIVGEHGARSIPVFPGERDWRAVCEELHRVFPSIVDAAGPARNLASGILLAQLVENIVTGADARHTVCAWHPDYDLCVTWPHEFGGGAWLPSALELGPLARKALGELIHNLKGKYEYH